MIRQSFSNNFSPYPLFYHNFLCQSIQKKEIAILDLYPLLLPSPPHFLFTILFFHVNLLKDILFLPHGQERLEKLHINYHFTPGGGFVCVLRSCSLIFPSSSFCFLSSSSFFLSSSSNFFCSLSLLFSSSSSLFLASTLSFEGLLPGNLPPGPLTGGDDHSR